MAADGKDVKKKIFLLLQMERMSLWLAILGDLIRLVLLLQMESVGPRLQSPLFSVF